MASIWDENVWEEDVWSDDELSEEEVIIPEETPTEEIDEEDNSWFLELMADDEEEELPEISSMKADPLLSAWVPAVPIKPVGNVSENAKYAYNYLNNRGLPSHVSAGIVGNLMKESGVNPTVRDGDKRGGIGGIAQWDPSRSANLRKYSGDRNPQDLDVQLDFLLHEAQQRGDLQKTLQAQTPEEAAMIFGRSYERPNEKYADWGSRQSYARNIMSKQHGGKAQYGVSNIPNKQVNLMYKNPLQERFDKIQPVVPPPVAPRERTDGDNYSDTVTTFTDMIHSGLDTFQQFKNRMSKVGAQAAQSVSEAIDISTEIAGNQRNSASLRKFNRNKNLKNYSVNNQSLNQPLIYT